jgi:hypothetical protein
VPAGDEEEKGDSNKKKCNSNDDLIVFVKDTSKNYDFKKNYYIPFDVGVFATTALDAEFGCGVLKNGRTNII